MAKNEVEELKQKILKTDLSVNSHGIQQIIENEVVYWVKSHKDKKENPNTHGADCYGKPGDIPDTIIVDGVSYSPSDILTHVRVRDDIGKVIVEKIYNNRKKVAPEWEDINSNIATMISDDIDLDEIAGYIGKKITRREIFQEVINVDPKSPLLVDGIPDAIMMLYSNTQDKNMRNYSEK